MKPISRGHSVKQVIAERDRLRLAAAELAIVEAVCTYRRAGGHDVRCIELVEIASMLVEQDRAVTNPATAASVTSTIPKDAPVTNPPPKPPTWLDTNRVIDAKAAAALCGVTAQTWRRMYTSGRAPAPIRLSVRRIGWRISTLLEWLASKEKP